MIEDLNDIDNQLNQARVLDKQGYNFLAEKDFDGAIMSFYKALQIRQNIFGEDYEHLSLSYRNLRRVFNQLDNRQILIDIQLKCVDLLIKDYGEEYRLLIYYYKDIGSLYLSIENYQMSLEYFRKALFLNVEMYGILNRLTADLYSEIGRLYSCEQLKDFDESIKAFMKAHSIYKELLGEEDNQTVERRNEIIKIIELHIRDQREYFAELINTFIKAHSLYEKLLGTNNDLTVQIRKQTNKIIDIAKKHKSSPDVLRIEATMHRRRRRSNGKR